MSPITCLRHSSPPPPQHCSSRFFAQLLPETQMTGRLDPVTSFSPPSCLVLFFPSSSHTPPSLCLPALPPSLPPHPRTAEPFRKSEVEAEQKNGPAQSPPSRPGLAVNPFLGWLAPVLLALEVKAKRGEGREAAGFGGPGPLSLVAPGQPLYNFRADLEQLARAHPPPPSTSRKWWGGQEMAQGSVFTKAYTSSPLHYTWFSPA